MSDTKYAHMCRMDHTQIGHNDSETESCPLCEMKDENNALTVKVERLEEALEKKAPTTWHEMLWHDADIREQTLTAENAELKESLKQWRELVPRTEWDKMKAENKRLESMLEISNGILRDHHRTAFTAVCRDKRIRKLKETGNE